MDIGSSHISVLERAADIRATSGASVRVAVEMAIQEHKQKFRLGKSFGGVERTRTLAWWALEDVIRTDQDHFGDDEREGFDQDWWLREAIAYCHHGARWRIKRPPKDKKE